MSMLLAVALGDVTGVGPEVTLKAISAALPEDDTRYLIVGDRACLERWNGALGLKLEMERFDGSCVRGRVAVHETMPGWLGPNLEIGAPEASQAALSWLEDGARRCLAGEAQALVTAPVSKEAIIRSGLKTFVGQTEFLARLSGAARTVMMLLGPDDRGRWLRVALATTHVPLKEVPTRLSKEKVEEAILAAAQACADLGLPRARVAVCGLNPHAGEGGLLGTEEGSLVTPAIESAREKHADAAGPFAADSIFYQALRGDWDAIVAMYHDQGLTALKMAAFERGVNWSLGLPFIRTSPDHGTAYDIAGRGLANPSSMIAALRLARQLAQRRKAGGNAPAP